MAPLITLTTDFGEADAYVAAMKGVLATTAPMSNILDLSHQIPPHDITAGAIFLRDAVPWFPPGTIHIAVVDPGVGTARNPVAIALDGQVVIGPDNGLTTLLTDRLPVSRIMILDPEKCAPKPVSATFHGRDLFAPAAALLATGTPLEQLGNTSESLVKLDWPTPEHPAPNTILGIVVYTDAFGNCSSNIPASWLADSATATVSIGHTDNIPLCRTYGDAPPGTAMALVGSSGFLEIAVNHGSAATTLGITRGMTMKIILDPPASSSEGTQRHGQD